MSPVRIPVHRGFGPPCLGLGFSCSGSGVRAHRVLGSRGSRAGVPAHWELGPAWFRCSGPEALDPPNHKLGCRRTGCLGVSSLGRRLQHTGCLDVSSLGRRLQRTGSLEPTSLLSSCAPGARARRVSGLSGGAGRPGVGSGGGLGRVVVVSGGVRMVVLARVPSAWARSRVPFAGFRWAGLGGSPQRSAQGSGLGLGGFRSRSAGRPSRPPFPNPSRRDGGGGGCGNA